MRRRAFAIQYVVPGKEDRALAQTVVYASSEAEASSQAYTWFADQDDLVGGDVRIVELNAEDVGVPDDEELRHRQQIQDANDAFGDGVPDWMRGVGGVDA